MNIPRLPYREDKLFGWLFAAVLLVPVAFSLFTYENFEILKYCLFLVFTGAGLLAVVLQAKQPARKLRAGKIFYWFLGLFWLWALLSSLLAWDKNYSFFGFYTRFTNGFFFYTAWAVFIFLLNLLNGEQIRFLLKTLVFTSGLVALWGILQSVGFGFYLGLTTDFFNRAAPSFLGNTDFSSMFVVSLLPLTILFLLRGRGLWQKIYYGLSGFVQLLSLFVFASRGALVALVTGLLAAVFLVVRFGRGKILVRLAVMVVILAVTAGLGIIFLNFSRPQAFQSIASVTDVNTQNRLQVWRLSVDSAIRRPIFGVGLGNFQLMFEHDRTPNLNHYAGFFDDAHNLLLHLTVTGGIFLALWFLCLIAAAIVGVWPRLKSDGQAEGIALLSALAAWFAASMFTPVAIPCYLLLAVLLSACFSQSLGAVVFKSVYKGALIAGAVVLVALGVVFLSAEILFYQGTQLYKRENYAEAYKFTAAAASLYPFNRLYLVFQTGSAINSGQPLPKVGELVAKTQKLNSRRSYSYIQLASLDYLLLYRTKDRVYINSVLENIRRAIALDPHAPGNFFTLSAYQLVFGDLAGAQASAQAGLALNPNFEEGEIFLAKTYQLQNNQQATLLALSAAAQIQPDDLAVLKLWHEMQQAKSVLDVPFNINLPLGQLN